MPMTPEELERLAHAGSELPALLPMEEQMLFLSLRLSWESSI